MGGSHINREKTVRLKGTRKDKDEVIIKSGKNNFRGSELYNTGAIDPARYELSGKTKFGGASR